jgi:hypothetical protein
LDFSVYWEALFFFIGRINFYRILVKINCTYNKEKGAKMNSLDNNPLSDIINDEVYELLNSRGLLNEKSLRDYKIRRMFKLMRENNVASTEAIETIRNEYPYLQFDTIRKIVYQIQK